MGSRSKGLQKGSLAMDSLGGMFTPRFSFRTTLDWGGDGNYLDRRECVSRTDQYLDSRFRIPSQHPSRDCFGRLGDAEIRLDGDGLRCLRCEPIRDVLVLDPFACSSVPGLTASHPFLGPRVHLCLDRRHVYAVDRCVFGTMDVFRDAVLCLAFRRNWVLFQGVFETQNQQHGELELSAIGLDSRHGSHGICPDLLLCLDAVGRGSLFGRGMVSAE